MLATLIVTKNGLTLTKRCLESVRHLSPHVLVLDNASSDGTQKYLRTINWATVVTGTFTSLAAAWNYGLKTCFRHYDFVLVLNNDTELMPQMPKLLLEKAHLGKPQRHGIVSGISVRSIEEVFVPKIIMPPSYHPDFSCFMISRECYQDVGDFDESYLGAYCEDCDYHVRMFRKGWLAVGYNIPFYHFASGTSKFSTEEEREKIGFMANQNRERFKAKYGCLPGTPEYQQLFQSVEQLQQT